jgi:hypothetical protein
MYYPFLRGRQFELIAIRELASENSTQGVIIPIIEPVKKSNSNLIIAERILRDNQQKAYLIINPLVGETIGDQYTILDFIAELNSNVFLPAFHYRTNSEYIQRCIDQFNLRNCMLIGPNEISPDDEGFQALLLSDQITHITIEDPDRNRSLKRYIYGTGKQFIRLDDFFERQPRNSNFLDIESHRFSEKHSYFNQDGYHGFSDYTSLPSEFFDGGSTPRAVVIHLTYMNDQNQI